MLVQLNPRPRFKGGERAKRYVGANHVDVASLNISIRVKNTEVDLAYPNDGGQRFMLVRIVEMVKRIEGPTSSVGKDL